MTIAVCCLARRDSTCGFRLLWPKIIIKPSTWFRRNFYWIDSLLSTQSIYIHQMSLRLFSTWLSSANETKACACTKSRLRLFIAMLFLSLWRQYTMYRGLSVKLGLGHWQTVQTQIRRRRTWRLIRICIVCLNYRKLRVKWNDCKFPFRTIFPAHRDNRPTSVVSALIIICFYSGFSLQIAWEDPTWTGHNLWFGLHQNWRRNFDRV